MSGDNTEQNLLANVRLCDAIKWHPCLYDSKSKVYQMKHAVDAAWQSIANECEDTVGNCKLRWRIIRKSFLRSFRKNVPYNRYYLNDYLDFLKPHLPTLESNEDRASKAEDYDIIQLDEEQQGDDDDDDVEQEDEEDDENDGHQDEDEEHHDDEDEVEANDEEVEEYELRDDNLEDPDEDSDTASAEETHKATRSGRRKDKGSNMSTPDIEEGEDNENQGSQDKTADADRIGRRLMRTRKANTRYSEYDIYDKRVKKDPKQEEKSKANKRSLEPNILEKTECKLDEKRPRRLLERTKPAPTIIREELNKTKILPKKVEVKLVKPKGIEPPPPEAKVPKPVPKEVIKVRTSCIKIDKTLAEMARNTKPKMVDNSTNSVATKTMDRATQYEVDEPNTVDDDFVESLKPQIALMNSRQKFSFKKRVFQALMDVFDDSTNFPNKNELIELPTKGAPRFDSTTTGELRLMRELVNLVTAAKSTPEIMNAKEKVATPDDDIEDLTPSPTKAPFEKSSQTSSTSTSNATTSKRSETLGLPRHILQKVVKVAGSNGGTILAHEGDKRRVYRIYPKGTLPPSVANNTGVSNPASIGTFYVTPPKSQVSNNTQLNAMVRTTTQVGNTANGKPITFTTLTKAGTQQLNNSSTASTPVSMMPPVTNKMSITNGNAQVAMSRQRLSGRHQISQRRYSITNTASKNSPVQNKVVTSTNPPATSAIQEKPSSSNAYPVQRFSASALENSSKSGLSQIQISQPISLNAAATNRENSVKAFLSSGQDMATYEGNSGDNEIFPDNPQPECDTEDVAINNNLLLANANIKDEPMD